VLRRDIANRDKIEERAYISYLLGFDSTNIFNVWVLVINRVIRTRDVFFKNNEFYRLFDVEAQSLGNILSPSNYKRVIEEIEL
jgi:hypothetical protein